MIKRFLEWLLCVMNIHLPRLHAASLGWCEICGTPLVRDVSLKGEVISWRTISKDDWKKLHELAIAVGWDECRAKRETFTGEWN